MKKTVLLGVIGITLCVTQDFFAISCLEASRDYFARKRIRTAYMYRYPFEYFEPPSIAMSAIMGMDRSVGYEQLRQIY
jgi:hypothetical protein